MEKTLYKKLKKIVVNPMNIILYIASKGLMNWLSDKQFLKIYYYARIGKRLNLKNPQTFNEKLQWLKIYDRKPEYVTYVDKYAVREYIKNVVGEQYLVPLIGVYDSVDEIDFSMLPNEFVLKCTHDSGSVVICTDKINFNIDRAKKRLKRCINRNYYYLGREWPYKNIKPRLVCEKMMNSQIIDYKFFCFSGKPKFLYVGQGLVSDHSLKIDFYDLDWNKMPFKRTDYDNFDSEVQRTDKFEEMLDLVEKLAVGFPFIRVDLYVVKNQIYFSEFTFTPCSGFLPLEPAEYDEVLGRLIELPKAQDSKYILEK